MNKILIVDDDQINARTTLARLEKRGHTVFHVENGRSCLDFVKNNSVDLILLDIIMPDLSGIEVLKILRENHSQFELPIIMLTATDDTEVLVEALKRGANDYINKPINILVAMARIQAQISLRELSLDSNKKKQVEAINAMIVTYNHELNNPLAIALGMLGLAKDTGEEKYFINIKDALDRMNEIIKKIKGVNEENLSMSEYSEESQMISLEKKKA